jgi:protein TonB
MGKTKRHVRKVAMTALVTRGVRRAATSAWGVSIAAHAGVVLLVGVRVVSSHLESGPVSFEVAMDTEAQPPTVEPDVTPNDIAPATVRPVTVAMHDAVPSHRDARSVKAVSATDSKSEGAPAAAPAAVVGDDALPHFAIATSSGEGGESSLSKSAGAGPLVATPASGPYAESGVDVLARALRRARPVYPLAAQAAGLEAIVLLEIVLSEAGAIESVRALTHPRHDFEEAAIAAARASTFAPAMKGGRPVPVRMIWTVEFHLE